MTRSLGVLLLLLGGCFSRDPAKLCQGESDCKKDSSCIVGRCRSVTVPAAATDSRRIVLMPTDIAVLSSKTGERVDVDAVPFGRASLGDVVLLLRFDSGVSERVVVDHAVLTLSPPEHVPAAASPIELSVSSIEDDWHSDALSWARQPPLSVGETVSSQSTRGRLPARIDVTHLYRSSEGLPDGLAILARGDDPVGELYSTGLGSGTPPRLELYVSDRPLPGAAPSASASASASAAPNASAAPSASPDATASAAAETPRPRRPRPPTPPYRKPPRPRH